MASARGLVGFMVAVLACAVAPSSGAMQFRAGDYYTTDAAPIFGSTIYRYNQAGEQLGSHLIPETNTTISARGLAFGPDGLLYVVFPQDTGFRVHAYDSAFAVQRAYTYGNGFLNGPSYTGKIAFDAAGNFFVDNSDGLIKFTPATSTVGSLFHDSADPLVDVVVKPDGNLFVATDYDLFEISGSTGSVMRTIDNPLFSFVRAIEYDAATDRLFVGASVGLAKFNATTGEHVSTGEFWHVVDLLRDADGRIVAGTGAFPVPAGIFNQALGQIGSLNGAQSVFVAQMVPEPASAAATIPLLLGAWLRRRHRRARPGV